MKSKAFPDTITYTMSIQPQQFAQVLLVVGSQKLKQNWRYWVYVFTAEQ